MPLGGGREVGYLSGQPDSCEVILKKRSRLPGKLADLVNDRIHPGIVPSDLKYGN